MPTPVADSKEIDIFIRCLDVKKYRELLCRTYIDEHEDLALQIIEHWKLKRINEKYVLKSRMYTENSYSKKKIKLEEKYFINKIHLLETYIAFRDKQSKFEMYLNNCLKDPQLIADNEALYGIIYAKWEELLDANV